ncbi:MAG TPA: 3'-5' exonuclease [Anaerolineales bacterium]|nr:3'-5' exonuclease [Anaerolineales bacterium]
MNISARAQAIELAREKLSFQPLYLDTETTGTGQQAEIVEICVIDDLGQILFNSLVKPLRRIPSDAIQIHGITNELVRSAPLWTDVWSQVSEVLDNRQVGVYNAEFDTRLIKQTLNNYRLSWHSKPSVQFFCIMKLFAQFRGDWNPSYRNYRWHSLENAGLYSKIALPNSHRACDDARLARAILHFIADQII